MANRQDRPIQCGSGWLSCAAFWQFPGVPVSVSLSARGLLLLCLLPALAWADFGGKVVKVADGDTVTVLRTDGARPEQVRVRLSSIDAPEKRQPWGTRSRQLLSDLVFDRQVRVEELGTDRYGRTIGVVHVGRLNANREMVRQGLAWAYRQYLNDSALLQVEAAARRARRGLWVDPSPVAPWDFRRQQAAERAARRAAQAPAAD